MTIRDVTDRELDQLVECAGKRVLVGFWKPGCGSCQALMRMLDAMQKDLTEEVTLLKLSSVPVLALYRNGLFERFTRLRRKPRLPVFRSSLLRRMDQAVEECAAGVLRPVGNSLWAACRSLGEGGHAPGFVAVATTAE